DGSVHCLTRPCEENCSHPVGTDGCCPICEDCLYENQIHHSGESVISERDPCNRCACEGGNMVCQTIICPVVNCLTPFRQVSECCPSCPVCSFLGEDYEEGSEFPHPEDQCRVCKCERGRVRCQSQSCDPQCSHPRLDMCCPVCDECFFDGVLYDNQAIFKPDSCRTCSCSNGNVACTTETCPDLRCILRETPPGACCEQCKGCLHQGLQHVDGSKWILEENPCITCMCHGGIVTCMQVECYVPCSNPVAVPGQCCPVCPTCTFSGDAYRDGDIFSPNGDPCDVCSCENGNLHCVHENCPNVANCPPDQLILPRPGECCPTCAGFGTNCSRDHFGMVINPRPEDPCFFCKCEESFSWICMKKECPLLNCPPPVLKLQSGQCCPTCPACYVQSENQYYEEGAVWSSADNPCISCQCMHGSVQCDIVECPPVRCSPQEELVKPPGQCCEFCQQLPESNCLYQGIVYQDGQQWTVDECTNCECLSGGVQCATKRCPNLECGPEETPSVPPGYCCPVCLAKSATCLVFGDPHYRTFDGFTIHFQGTCKYIMAADCDDNDFSVEVQHDNRGSEAEVSWAQNFTIRIAGITVDLLQNHVVRVDERKVSLPYFKEPHLYMERSGDSVLLNTNVGLMMIWNGNSYAELSVPGSYKRKMCGLCGNFNGFPQDDLKTRSGHVTNSPAVFGNTWKASTQYSDECKDVVDIDPCAEADYRIRKMAVSKCSIIKSSTFSRCHRAVSFEPFLSSCIYDMCACGSNPDCLCEILSSYAHECAKAGVRVEWRTPTLCAFGCQENKGFLFDECGPVCPRTCENRHKVLGDITENCYKPCVASCQCPADKVVHNGACISQDECPDIHHTEI
ncbi:hypothetical protein ScPMuIL_013384, partial [Solemya velum]